MVSEKTHTQSQIALKSLSEAVQNELVKKAKLGQDAIIWRDGKACRVKASELVSGK